MEGPSIRNWTKITKYVEIFNEDGSCYYAIDSEVLMEEIRDTVTINMDD